VRQLMRRVACLTMNVCDATFGNRYRRSASSMQIWCVDAACRATHPCIQTYDAQETLETNILRIETQYLEETSAGNIIKGFDNYIKGAAATSTAGGAGTTARRKAQVSDADRIFSRSSSYLRVRSRPFESDPLPRACRTAKSENFP
jgi:hypothetical protein